MLELSQVLQGGCRGDHNAIGKDLAKTLCGQTYKLCLNGHEGRWIQGLNVCASQNQA